MRTRHHHTLPLLAIFSVLLLLLGACRDPQITTYTAPKDPAPAAMPAAAGGTTSVSSVPTAALTWTAPAAWTPKAPTQMVKASYTIPAAPNSTEAAATISSFPGEVGGIFANVNRWRGQIGLPPIAEKDLPANIAAIENGALHFTIVDITNDATGARMLGAILPVQGETYFFKMTGPAATVAAQKQAFLDLLQTVKVQQQQ